LEIDPAISDTLGDPETRAKDLATETLIESGDTLAQDGDVEAAISKYRQALEIDLTINDELGDPEMRANAFVAQTLIEDGARLVQVGAIQEAISIYQNAIEMNPTLIGNSTDPESRAKKLVADQLIYIRDNLEQENDASTLNNLCWHGSLSGYAWYVKDICERAVELAPNNGGYIDSRGLNLALLGDYEAAIADFEIAILWFKENAYAEYFILEREAWIQDLKAGMSPFDEELLEYLFTE
jgi:tetratricopeptide (TPR) repeat protein